MYGISKRLPAVVAAASLWLAASPAPADMASELRDVKIIGHHFSSEVRTMVNRLGVRDPSKGRWVVLKLSARVPKDEAVIFSHDFILRYFHNGGREDRTTCDGICTAKTVDPGDFGVWHGGVEPRVTVHRGLVYLGLAAYIEPDVTSIELARVGTGDVVRHRIGGSRPYSVFITTNADPRTLEKAKRTIQTGGYRVTGASNGLRGKETGITIHYAENAESQARDISSRLMLGLNVAPRLKKYEGMVSEVDVVVWLGE